MIDGAFAATVACAPDMSLLRQTLLWASRSPTLARRLPRLGFVRRAVSAGIGNSLTATAPAGSNQIDFDLKSH